MFMFTWSIISSSSIFRSLMCTIASLEARDMKKGLSWLASNLKLAQLSSDLGSSLFVRLLYLQQVSQLSFLFLKVFNKMAL